MTMTSRFSGLSDTSKGRTRQINRTFSSMATKMKTKQVESADCDQPQTLPDALRLIAHLQNRIAEYEDLLNERAQANNDQITDVSKMVNGWGTERVAAKSGKSISTICRHALELGGIKIGSDWVFPAGTTYTGGRGKKKKVQ